MPNSAALRRSVSTWVRDTGSAIGRSMFKRGGVVILGGQGQVRPAHRTARLAEAVERLRTGHLVHEVQVDEEQIRLALGGADDVVVPYLFAQCLAHDL